MADGEAKHASMIVLGRISGLHGVKGWVKVFSDTSPRENILNYSPWYLEGPSGWQPYEVTTGRPHGKTLVAKLLGCDDREQARALMGRRIAISRTQLPGGTDREQGEFYWADLQGLSVLTEQGEHLGQVSHLFETGSNDVLVVKGKKEHWIPWTWQQAILQVDLNRGVIIVDWDPEF